MEKFKFEIPTIQRKQEALNYINEFYKYGSNINGSGGLNKYIENYEKWLEKIENESKVIPNEKMVPAVTYFLVRESDNKIVGMSNIRLALNDRLKKIGGHIGYSIRPTERGKGYNKINLYLALKVCNNYGIKEVFMDCEKSNLASARTILALGGKLVREWYDDEIHHAHLQDYIIDVDKSLDYYKDIYEPLINDNESHFKKIKG